MTYTNAAFGAANPCVRFGEMDGEHVAYVRLHNGAEALVSAASWERHLWLGFPSRLTADSDGQGRRYPRFMAHDPSSDATRSWSTSLARTLLAALLVAEEVAGGSPAAAKGWVVRHANGNRLDCRDGNLVCSPAVGSRNGVRAVWNVRERWKLASRGLDPNAVFAERRKEARKRARSEVGKLRAPDISGRTGEVISAGERARVPPSIHPSVPLAGPGVGRASDGAAR